jgi:hypothetical protein
MYIWLIALALIWLVSLPITRLLAAEEDDTAIALRLAELLRSARTIISQNQTLINEPGRGDKGLTGEKVTADTIALYLEKTGQDPRTVDPATREGRLLNAELKAIEQVMAENQSTINAEGVGFKGFIPAVFARLVGEKFSEQVGEQARIKVTAPEDLIRNRKARPDAWESAVIQEHFGQASWPKGQPFSEQAETDGRAAFRLLVPEYYVSSCLACHGEPAGEMDITGYPKEGGHEGDLGAAISITLFQ